MSALKPGTPLPWAMIDTSIVTTDTCVAVLEEKGEYVACREDRDANGRYIIAACNAYPDLVEALEFAELLLSMPEVEALRLPEKHLGGRNTISGLEMVRAALKKARGEA